MSRYSINFSSKIHRILTVGIASILPSHRDPDFVLINVHEEVVDVVEVVHHLQEHDQFLFAEIR